MRRSGGRSTRACRAALASAKHGAACAPSLSPRAHLEDVAVLGALLANLPGEFAVDLDVALRPDEKPSTALLVDTVGAVLRADSPDAPSTHAEAMRQGDVWLPPEAKELANHARNASWTAACGLDSS